MTTIERMHPGMAAAGSFSRSLSEYCSFRERQGASRRFCRRITRGWRLAAHGFEVSGQTPGQPTGVPGSVRYRIAMQIPSLVPFLVLDWDFFWMLRWST
jgi:hypothetical protein